MLRGLCATHDPGVSVYTHAHGVVAVDSGMAHSEDPGDRDPRCTHTVDPGMGRHRTPETGILAAHTTQYAHIYLRSLRQPPHPRHTPFVRVPSPSCVRSKTLRTKNLGARGGLGGSQSPTSYTILPNTVTSNCNQKCAYDTKLQIWNYSVMRTFDLRPVSHGCN